MAKQRELKEGYGACFRIKEKKSERSPDFFGRALIDGQEKLVSIWKNHKRSDGSVFLGLAIRDVDDEYKTSSKESRNRKKEVETDEIPI